MHRFTAGSIRGAFSHLFRPVLHTWYTPSGPCWTINLQLSISMKPCQGFMIIFGQGGLPLSTGRSFKWLWLSWSASLAASSLTSDLVSNGSYQRPLWIWFRSIPTAQVNMLIIMCQNTLIQWCKREATRQIRRTSAVNYLRYITRWGLG